MSGLRDQKDKRHLALDRSKASRKGPRFIECFNGRVVVFIKGSYEIPPGRATSKIAILSGDLFNNVERHQRITSPTAYGGSLVLRFD